MGSLRGASKRKTDQQSDADDSCEFKAIRALDPYTFDKFMRVCLRCNKEFKTLTRFTRVCRLCKEKIANGN